MRTECEGGLFPNTLAISRSSGAGRFEVAMRTGETDQRRLFRGVPLGSRQAGLDQGSGGRVVHLKVVEQTARTSLRRLGGRGHRHGGERAAGDDGDPPGADPREDLGNRLRQRGATQSKVSTIAFAKREPRRS
jgi:hypothetical protein